MTIPTGSNLLMTLPKTAPVAAGAIKGDSSADLSASPVTSDATSTDKDFSSVLKQQMTEASVQKNGESTDGKEISAELIEFCCVQDATLELAQIPDQIDTKWIHGLMPFLPESNELKAELQGDVEAIELENELPLGQMILPALNNRQLQGGESLPQTRQVASVNPGAVMMPQRSFAANATTLPSDPEVVIFSLTSATADAADMPTAGQELESSLLKSENFKSAANEFNLTALKESFVAVQSGMSVVTPTATGMTGMTGASLATPEMQLSTQLPASQWGEALGEKVAFLLNHKLNKAEIRIDPPHLGKLDIQIQLKDDSATVVIHTQHAQTRDMIESASVRLKEFLQEAGYNTVNVDVSQREQSFSGDHLSSGQQAEQKQDDVSSSLAAEQSSEGWQQSMLSMRVNDGRIDYFA
ncbi:MAG: flagellar hook-length control protein FliK [Gammaproteobacteria bacterium]|nr:flagellar hook-length control protein FliK [Gammaproteobacteria bacterium]MBL6998269.1 flagellar hook-length control protein FliK [Gammaproteobacteria bacterium]